VVLKRLFFLSLWLCALTVASPAVAAALLTSGDSLDGKHDRQTLLHAGPLPPFSPWSNGTELDGEGSPDDEEPPASEQEPETEQTGSEPEPPWWSSEAVELRNERRRTGRTSKAESGDRTDSNGVYVEAASLLISNAVVVNAERWVGKQTAISAGIGRSAYTWLDGNYQTTGPRVQVHGFLGKRARFEVAGGVAVGGSVVHGESRYDGSEEVSVAYEVTPTVYAGFRGQPAAGGFVFRFGVGWVHTHAVGPSISLGMAF